MNSDEQFEIGAQSAEWVVKEANTLLEKYKKSTPEEQTELLSKMKHMFARLKFEGKELEKYIEENYGN